MTPLTLHTDGAPDVLEGDLGWLTIASGSDPACNPTSSFCHRTQRQRVASFTR